MTYGGRINEVFYDESLPSCGCVQVEVTKNKVPYLVTHDGRTIRYPDPLIKVRLVYPMFQECSVMWSRIKVIHKH